MKQILFFLCAVAVCISYSCSEIYDNIKDFAPEETVYVGKFDQTVAYAGFERVEIDLLIAGQTPSGDIKLGKAKKTVVEYDSTVITYDSVRSWVNITGLKTPKMYRFYIYNIDEYGNKSIPVEATAIPYTQEDLDALVLPSPLQTISPTSVEFNWPDGLSSGFFDFVDVIYAYTDKNGVRRSGKTADTKFVVTNLEKGTLASVEIKCRIIPKISNNPIIDTINMDRTVTVLTITEAEYLASRTSRIVAATLISGTDGKVIWGDVTDHLALSEIRYKNNSGTTTTLRALPTDTTIVCKDVKPGELFEHRSAFVPTSTVDTFYSVWKTSAVPFLDLPVGTYKVSADSYRNAPVTSEYSSEPRVTITGEGDGKYRLSDMFGGFYEIGREYGESYRMYGIFSYDGTNMSLIEAQMDPWGYGFDALTGNWDATTQTLTLRISWAGYIFHLILIKE
jgi:hypothetical protein